MKATSKRRGGKGGKGGGMDGWKGKEVKGRDWMADAPSLMTCWRDAPALL